LADEFETEMTVTVKTAAKEQVMARRIKLVPFPVTEENTIDLPDGAVLVALDFVDEGGQGAGRRPATAWAEVPSETV
jgi:hypothetical protein